MKSSLAGQEDHVWQVAEVAARQLLFERGSLAAASR